MGAVAPAASTAARRFPAWLIWPVVFLAWMALSAVFAPEVYVYARVRGEPLSLGRAFLLTLANAGVAALFAPLIVLLARRFPLERGRWRVSLAVHLPASVLFAFAHELVYWLSCYVSHALAAVLLERFHPNVLTYWAIVAGSAAFDYLRRARERERQLAELRLELFKAQLSPHFLFNTLNTIAAMVREDPRAAERMVTRLSDLLRLTLDGLSRQERPLEAELRLTESYLEIQRVRFAGGLVLETRVEPGTEQALVPSMLLQPLVENAVRHGFGTLTRGAVITLDAGREGDLLRLVLADNGAGPAPLACEGIGLSATRRRLEQLYPGRNRLELGPNLPRGARLVVELPFHAAVLEACA